MLLKGAGWQDDPCAGLKVVGDFLAAYGFKVQQTQPCRVVTIVFMRGVIVKTKKARQSGPFSLVS